MVFPDSPVGLSILLPADNQFERLASLLPEINAALAALPAIHEIIVSVPDAPGGLLILGTPDYARWQWIVIEWLYQILLPQAYADEHITHYTYSELIGEFVEKRGYRLEAVQYILQGELIMGLRKPLLSNG